MLELAKMFSSLKKNKFELRKKIVLDCLRYIFVTYRSSYQADLDVLHVKYLLPGCFFLAFLLRARFHEWDAFFNYVWSACLYVDVLALMPQVVMMAPENS